LTIPKNKTIAIVGPSGCGKSTVASLIQRIYDCHAGDVMINGMNLKDLNISQYRQMIGVVSQEPSLFASTIGENIAIGLPNATKEMIEQAACMANCDFINTLPQKYDTDLGDMGDQLSGGEFHY
jgi:ABC-type multidrug transport system fused ATPase/permease subunit